MDTFFTALADLAEDHPTAAVILASLRVLAPALVRKSPKWRRLGDPSHHHDRARRTRKRED